MKSVSFPLLSFSDCYILDDNGLHFSKIAQAQHIENNYVFFHLLTMCVNGYLICEFGNEISKFSIAVSLEPHLPSLNFQLL